MNKSNKLKMHVMSLLSLYHMYMFMISLLVVWIMIKSIKKGSFKLELSHQLEYIFLIIPICVIILLTKYSLPYLYSLCSVTSSSMLMMGFQWYWMINNKECFFSNNLNYMMSSNEIYLYGDTKSITGSANDVIHSIYIPSMCFKMDLVPGRLSNQVLFGTEMITYGVCAEICGANHAFMPFKFCTMR